MRQLWRYAKGHWHAFAMTHVTGAQEVQRLEAALKGGNLPSQVQVGSKVYVLINTLAPLDHSWAGTKTASTTPWTKVKIAGWSQATWCNQKNGVCCRRPFRSTLVSHHTPCFASTLSYQPTHRRTVALPTRV